MIARTEPPALDDLAMAAFSHLRRVGASRAELSELEVAGRRYLVHVDTPVRMVANMLTLRDLGACGAMRSMVVLEVQTHHTPDVSGMDLLMRAMEHGAAFDGPAEPRGRRWHVLPWVAVPASLHSAEGDSEALSPR